jgi:hypothetical protein
MFRSARLVAIVGGVALLGLVVLTGVVAAAVPNCVANIHGTYYRSGDFVMTLAKDRSVVGQYSQTTQDAIGLEESFSGSWNCAGNDVTLTTFHFLDDGTNRYVERGNATGTFVGAQSQISFDYTFHVFPENASESDLKSAMGTVTSVPGIVVKRVSTP